MTTLNGTGDAVKEMLEHIEQVFEGLPENEKVRLLVDFRPAGPPPLTEGIGHLRAFFQRQGSKTRRPVRAAYIYPRSAQGRILQAFLIIQRFLPIRATVRFFDEAEEEKARAWLNAA